MLNRLGVKLAKYLLESGNLSMEDSAILTGTVLSKLGALPFKDVFDVDDQGNLVIDGKQVDLEKAKYLRDSAISALNNQALSLICERVAFLAVSQGIHKAETIPQMYWGRVGIWWGENIKNNLSALAQEQKLPL